MTSAATPDPAERGTTWTISATDPFLTAERTPPGIDPGGLSRYGDLRWDLSPLAGPTSTTHRLNMERFSTTLRESFRRAAWALINLPISEILTGRPGSNRVSRPASGTMMAIFQSWTGFDTWMQSRHISRICDLTDADLEDYAATVAEQQNKHTPPIKALYSVSVLWGYAPHLPETDRVRRPPWEDGGLRDYLPPRRIAGENTTAPIHPAVMSPLLIWAMRFVDDFADDILAAWSEQQRLLTLIPAQPDHGAVQRIKALIEHYRTCHGALPGNRTQQRTQLACSYLAAYTGATPDQVRRTVDRVAPDLPVTLSAPLDIPIRGRVNGKPWQPHIGYYDCQVLMVRLSAACMIVLFYLSGMRPSEGLALQVGCCPEPDTDGAGSMKYKIHGNFFKNARDENGTHVAAGLPRPAPWTVIPPVARAIKVLENMTDGPLLFVSDPPWTQAGNGRRRAQAGKALATDSANGRLTVFVKWVNDYAQQNNLTNEHIPADPDGPIALSRLRRTVAWHIARIPGGRIALSTQYGHLRTVVSEGYSGRARSGLRRILDIETARAIADYLDQLADRIHAGEGVSGPAAGRMISTARASQARFGGMFLSAKQADALTREPQFQVYDNPAAFLTCNYDPLRALCRPQRNKNPGPPALHRCNPDCANIARTDTHIQALQHEVRRLRKEVRHPLTPTPLRERLKQRIAAYVKIAHRHQSHRTYAADEQEPTSD